MFVNAWRVNLFFAEVVCNVFQMNIYNNDFIVTLVNINGECVIK